MRTSVDLRSGVWLLTTLSLALAGCAAPQGEFVPADPGPIATERFNGEIVWRVTALPDEPRVEAAFEEPPARRVPGAVVLPRGLVQLTLLTQDDTALLLEHTAESPVPVRGKLSFGEEKPLYKIDYQAGTYREAKGPDPADEVLPVTRKQVTDEIQLRETSEQRVILGHLCTATRFLNLPRGMVCTVWATRDLLVNKAPLNYWERSPGPIDVMIASVRGVPLLIEVPGSVRVEAVSITQKPVDLRLLRPPGTAYRLVE
jgi:hypothetical protein